MMMRNKDKPETGSVHIRTLIKDVLKKQGIEKEIHAHRAVVYWDSIAGKTLSPYTKAVCVKGDTLYVEVNSSVRIHQLQMQEEEIRVRINKKLGKTTIQHIRFRLMNEGTQDLSNNG